MYTTSEHKRSSFHCFHFPSSGLNTLLILLLTNMVSFLPFSVLLGTALVCAAQQTINPVISSDAHAITGKLVCVLRRSVFLI